MVFDEDSSSKRKGFSVQNFSLINKIVLNLIRKNKDNDNERFKNKVGINTKRKIALYDETYLIELLNLI